MGVEVNLLRVLIAAVAANIIGFIWYSPKVFGTMWIKLSEITPAKIAASKRKGMGKIYATGFVSTVIIAYVLGLFMSLTDSKTIVGALLIGLLVWLGFIATTMLGMVLWESKPVKLYLINVLHYLVSILVMAVILVY
ncbi:MAG: DUF1761 domain-containing protein [Nanoarchaeota archaeon]